MELVVGLPPKESSKFKRRNLKAIKAEREKKAWRWYDLYKPKKNRHRS